MAIIIDLSNTAPHVSTGITSTIDVTVIIRSDLNALIPKAFDLCLYEAEHVELALAELGGVVNDDYKNDKKDFLFQLTLLTDTVTLKLFKNGVEVATITDNTYGVYLPPSSFPDSLKIGFTADWNKILDLLGVGCYHFTADRVIISQNSTLTSHKFNLIVFDEQRADGTIKVVTKQTGIIEGGTNYDGFEWTSYIRLNGFFGKPEYTLTVTNYIDSNRNLIQIQDSIKTVYTMSLTLHPSSVIIPFIKDKLLANEMFITGYGIFDFLERYKEIPVYAEGIEESKYFEMNTKGVFTFAFTDKQAVPIKRRFT